VLHLGTTRFKSTNALIISENGSKRQEYSFWSLAMIRLHPCPYCHDSSHVYLSRVKTLRDAAAFIFMLRPVRCHSCLRRFYRPFFLDTPTAPRTTLEPRKLPEDEDDRRSA
jgi:hypothetical protein